MARMGVYFEEEVQRRYPEFETRRGEWSWEDYLPPMSEGLRESGGGLQLELRSLQDAILQATS